LTDASLYDGSGIGAWKTRFEEAAREAASATVAVSGAAAAPSGAGAPAAAPPPAAPAVHPAALTAMANAGLVKELNARGDGKPLSADELEKMKASTVLRAPQFGGGAGASGAKPELLTGPRDGKGDDLGLIWGVADKLAERLNAMGIWHFDQIASWTPANVAWFEAEMDGFKGRIDRDKWIEQCQKLASGWRPGSDVGERPKG
jgi:NADH-quinone oxidoreductase subunit E